MKTKKIFSVGFICLIIVMCFSTYLWYLYFHNYEGTVLDKKVRLELINNGRINYINAVPGDDENLIPIYYFRVKNNGKETIKYNVLINDIPSSEAADGCSDENNFKRNELTYELKLDNKIVKTGLLSELNNDVVYTSNINSETVDDYSLRIWLASDIEKTLNRHYHYVVNIMEIE